MTRPYVIAVNAVSGGGKTTLARLLANSLPATLFCFDDFDDTNVHPEDLYEWSIRGANLLEFDSPGMREAVQLALKDERIRYVVLDYPFGRDHPQFREVIDLSVFIDTPLDIAMARRILRDHTIDSDSSAEMKLKLLRDEMAHYIEKASHPYRDGYRLRATCDLVLNGCESPEEWSKQILNRIHTSAAPEERPERLMGRHEAGAVLFTVNLRKLANFYEQVIGMHVVKTATDHVVLEVGTFRLTLHQIPEQYAKSIVISATPVVRENAAIKLSFRVKDISRSRRTASELGGLVNGPDREWSNEEATTCDGHDPDGNVFQLFQAEKANHEV
jgi:uridine kinase/predicted enzyme related to lactoylglutathione lyase